uniref:Tyr recombinase domain-containing protein n=1 Tax=Amphimedon queenslandica TaxID=400682 RepID=A0A1X7USH4_AMPQE
MSLGLGPIARLHTRGLYRLLNSRFSWFVDLKVSLEAKEELRFWAEKLVLYNGHRFWNAPSAVRVVFSDASGLGYGGYMVEHGCHVAQGQWTEHERGKSSTWRELAAVVRVLGAFASKLAGNRVKWCTDNQNVIEPEWIPRAENELADYFSRLIDYDDWSLNPAMFQTLNNLWGAYTVDRFASSQNSQLLRFNSRFWDAATEAVDTFTVNWKGENNWLCPPVYLIPRALGHARNCNCEGTIIVPQWRSAVFWPLLVGREGQFYSFVKDHWYIDASPGLVLPDILTTEIWQEIGAYKDPQLAHLSKALPDTVLKARADATVKKYLGAFNRWSRWAEPKTEITSFPVSTTQFVLYLQHVGEATKSKAAVVEAVNAISWIQRMAGQEEVSHNGLVKLVMEGLQRQLARPKEKKESITVEMLQEKVDAMSKTPSLSEVRLAAICLLAFAGFLRFSEIAGIRCCDVTISATKMVLNIVSSQTDQFRQGDQVPMARSGSVTCPVAMMERYIKLGRLELSSTGCLFRPLVHTKNGESLRPTGSISYTRLREIVMDKLKNLGYDPNRYGLHSFRAGGATAAANAPGLKDRLFKRHGRWKSESAKDGYVKDSEERRLEVSKRIGL